MKHTYQRLAFYTSLLLAASCTSQALGDDEERDANPPSVRIVAPERGTVLVAEEVWVSGYASDDVGVDRIEVNGVVANLQVDGYFEALVPAPTGLTLLQTVVADAAGNRATDTRSVMSGDLRVSDARVDDALVARLNEQTFSALGTMTGNIMETTDYAAIAAPLNPVIEMGGSCLGAQFDLLDVAMSEAVVDLVPIDGGLAVSIEVFDLDVDLFARFAVACIDGSSTVGITADRLLITGRVPITLSGDEILVDIVDVESTIDGLDLDVGILPDAIVDLANGLIESQVESILVDTLEQDVATMVEDFLAGFATTGQAFMIFGEEVVVTAAPTRLDFTTEGGTIVLDSHVDVTGSVGVGYVASPRPLPSSVVLDATGQGLRLGLADDMVNQALSAFWSSGALNLSFDLGSEDGNSSTLGDLVDAVQINMLLPPYARAEVVGESVQVTLGDMLVDIIDKSDRGEEVITRLAVSATIELGLESGANGELRLVTSTPSVWVDVIDQGIEGANILADEQIEALASAATGRVAAILDDLVGALPIPVFGGVSIVDITLETATGYLLLGGTLEAP